MRRLLPICLCLALAACHGDVSYRGPGMRYDGPVHPLAVVAVGAVMAYELAVLAAPAFTVEGEKPRSRAARAHAATPENAPDTLVLLTLTRGPAQDLPLADMARALNAELAARGLALAQAPGWSLDNPDDFRFSRLEQRGMRRALTVALDIQEKDGRTDAVAQLRLVDVQARETLAQETLRRSAEPDETPARAHRNLAPRLARAMAGMLAPDKDRNQ